jgi:hypothetical protein
VVVVMPDASMMCAPMSPTSAWKEPINMTVQTMVETLIVGYATTQCVWNAVAMVLVSVQLVMSSQLKQMASVSAQIPAIIS